MLISWKRNHKMTWPRFNLPAVRSCPNATRACAATCYALKAERMYKGAGEARARNLAAAMRPDFADRICQELAARRKAPRIFRIHESGDFFSKSYFLAWREIAERNPGIQFFAFTKRFDLFRFKRPDNLRLIASVYYDEERAVPKGAPVFRTVRRGETAPGLQCAGSCDTCGACPFVEDATEIWTEVH